MSDYRITQDDLDWLQRLIKPTDRVILSPGPLLEIREVPVKDQPGPGGSTYQKPEGLWYACGDEWLRFLTEEMGGSELLAGVAFAYLIKVRHSDMAVIRTAGELDDFELTYSTSPSGREGSIDWSLVSAGTTGIEICPYIGSRRMRDWYYTWDVASGCIWDPSAVSSIVQVFAEGERPGRRGPKAEFPPT